MPDKTDVPRAPRDWRDKEAYDDLKPLDKPGFAWEYLRRNQRFRDDAATRPAVIAVEHDGIAVIAIASATGISIGGCDFLEQPSIPALHARLFWHERVDTAADWQLSDDINPLGDACSSGTDGRPRAERAISGLDRYPARSSGREQRRTPSEESKFISKSDGFLFPVENANSWNGLAEGGSLNGRVASAREFVEVGTQTIQHRSRCAPGCVPVVEDPNTRPVRDKDAPVCVEVHPLLVASAESFAGYAGRLQEDQRHPPDDLPTNAGEADVGRWRRIVEVNRQLRRQ